MGVGAACFGLKQRSSFTFAVTVLNADEDQHRGLPPRRGPSWEPAIFTLVGKSAQGGIHVSLVGTTRATA